VLLRLAPSGLALSAVVLDVGGLEAAGFGLLLIAIPVAAAAALYAIVEVVDHERSRTAVAPAAGTLLLIVAAAAMRRPELALGCLVCLAAEWLLDSAESATRKRITLSAARESR
jgi:hypothetical protein